MNLICFSNFPGKQQHFHVGQNYPKEGFRILYFPAIHNKCRCEDTFCPQTAFCPQTIEYISKKASQQAGIGLFSQQ